GTEKETGSPSPTKVRGRQSIGSFSRQNESVKRRSCRESPSPGGGGSRAKRAGWGECETQRELTPPRPPRSLRSPQRSTLPLQGRVGTESVARHGSARASGPRSENPANVLEVKGGWEAHPDDQRDRNETSPIDGSGARGRAVRRQRFGAAARQARVRHQLGG